MNRRSLLGGILRVAVVAAWGLPLWPAFAQNTAQLDASAKRVYSKLVAKVPAARELGKNAVAVLVFPKITKVGLVFGGQYGEGVLLRGGEPVAYYSNTGGSWGL